MKFKPQPNIAKLQQVFGLTECNTGTLHYIQQDVIAFLSGFQIIFYDYYRNIMLNSLNLGENINKVNQIEFYNSNAQLLTCEDRPEGAVVSLYNRSAPLEYQLMHRLQLTIPGTTQSQPLQSVLLAKFISPSKLAVISGAPDFMFLVYENDQKTAVLPTFTLKISENNILQENCGTIKLLQLSDKELLLIAGQVLKTIRLQQSITKILPPNGFNTLSRKFTFTDGIFLNKHLKKTFKDIPVDADQLIILTTLEGVMVVMFKTTIVKEIIKPFLKEIQSVQFYSAQQQFNFSLQNNTDDSQKNFTFFNETYQKLEQQQEMSCGYLYFSGGQYIHCFGFRVSDFFKWVAKSFYANQTNWASQLDCDKVLVHLMSYNASIVVDQVCQKVGGFLGLKQILVNNQHLVGWCRSETSKQLIGVQLQLINKRLAEIDRLYLQTTQIGSDFRTEVENQLQSPDIKILISQDNLTQLKGEIVKLDTMEVNINSVNFLGKQETDISDVSLQYNPESQRELWLLQPPNPAQQITAVSTAMSKLHLLSKDRQMRVLSQQFVDAGSARFQDMGRQCAVHPSAKYAVLCGSNFVDVYQIFYDRSEQLHRFDIDFCNHCIFTAGGELMVANSGSHFYVIDFFQLKILYKITDLDGRILGLCNLFRDDVPAQYQYEIFLWTQNGTVCRFDLLGRKRVFQVVLKQKHVRTAAPISSQFQEEPYLVCILNDDSTLVIDKLCKSYGEFPVESVMSQQQALNLIKISGAATTDIICSVNDGEIALQKVYRGVPVAVLNVNQYIITGYSLGYVCIKNVAQSFTNFKNGEKCAREKELLLNLHSQSVISIVPADGGFIYITEDGLMYSFQLQDVTALKKLDDSKFTIISYQQLNQLENQIVKLKNDIFEVRVMTNNKKDALQKDFMQQMDNLINQTTEMTSQQLSEQSKLKTEHDNKTILLKRQIANNQALFKTSKQALDQQYTKRQVFMHDDIQKLKQQFVRIKEELETVERQTQLQLENELLQQQNQRDQDIQILEEEVHVKKHKIDEMKLQHDEFYKMSENELYREASQLQTLFFQQKIDLEAEMVDAQQQHKRVKEEYSVLEQQLRSNQENITKKKIQIQELNQLIQQTEKDIELSKQEIKQNELTLQQREKRILDLDQKIRELNKISFILQFKIRELKRTIKPKEIELEDLKQKLDEMNKELLQYKQNLKILKTNKKELQSKNLSLKQQIQNSAQFEQTTVKKLQEVRIEINKMILLINDQEAKFKQLQQKRELADRNIDYRMLVQQLKIVQECLYRKPNLLIQKKQLEEEEGNFSKMENNVVKLQQKLQKQKSSTKSSTSGVMAQNAQLMQEINQLRRELHQAMVQANSNCQIDEGLMRLYEQNRATIQQLRANIRQKEKQAQNAGYLPDLQ
uniref:WD40 and SMC domain-containing protein n=1 Tax=Trepomonas sp. PC1 TaxID=1076344 RepID=A0A146KEJ5_9EUKA|eukprot:JAP94628.1 WD40 and SMC domain-containing protein [Trepomonas sp. PC1]